MYVVVRPTKKLGEEYTLGSLGMKTPVAKVTVPSDKTSSSIKPTLALTSRFRKPSTAEGTLKEDAPGTDSSPDAGTESCVCPSCEEQGYVLPDACPKGLAWWWLLVAGAGGVALGYAFGAKSKAPGL